MDKEWIKFINVKPQVCQYFTSLEGEGNAIGELSLYVRLAYCSAKCKFCDTKFSWELKESNEAYDSDMISFAIRSLTKGRDIRRMTITGGEPLASIKYIPDIVTHAKNIWLDNYYGSNFSHLGIESNGAHAASLDNTVEILKNLNKIYKTHNIQTTLTISPKLQQNVSWYHTSMSQDDVDRMYVKAFTNLENYVSVMHNVNYKFIYDFTNEVIDFNHTEKFITYLSDTLKVPLRKILLMPLTPDDPMGRDREFWEQSKIETSKKCMEIGLRYSPRLHIDLGLD